MSQTVPKSVFNGKHSLSKFEEAEISLILEKDGVSWILSIISWSNIFLPMPVLELLKSNEELTGKLFFF